MGKKAPHIVSSLFLILITSLWSIMAAPAQALQNPTPTTTQTAPTTILTRDAASTAEAVLTATALPPTTQSELLQPTVGPTGTPVVAQTVIPSATVTPTSTLSPTATLLTPTATLPAPTATPVPPTATTRPVEPTAQATNAPNLTATPSPLPTPTQGVTDETPPNNQVLWWVITAVLALLFLLILIVVFRLSRRGKAETNQAAGGQNSKPENANVPAPQAAELVGAALADPLLLRDPTLLGRGDAMDSKFAADAEGLASVSLEHARIERRNNRWLLRDGIEDDRPSQEGVFVNDQRTRVNYLNDGDKIRLGKVELTFREPQQGANR